MFSAAKCHCLCPISGYFKPPTRTGSGNRWTSLTLCTGCVFTCSESHQMKWPELRWLLGVSPFVQPVFSAFTNPRRAIDGISGSLLSMEQGEALRMLVAVLLWGRGSRVVPPSPLV